MSKGDKNRTILARRGSRTISAVFDGDKFDDWQARNASTVLGWSKPGDRKANVGGELGDFFKGAREQNFESLGFRPTPEGRRAAKSSCNCNPDGDPVAWLPPKPKKPPPPQEKKSGRGSNGDGSPRSSDQWAVHLYQLGKALSPEFVEIGGLDFRDLKKGGTLADVAHRIAVAKADRALVHAHAAEDLRREHERQMRERRAAIARGDEVAPLPARPARQTHEAALAKRRERDANRRNLERIARAAADAKRDKKNAADRARRAAKKGKAKK